jgi:anti-sigma factor RsiW
VEKTPDEERTRKRPSQRAVVAVLSLAAAAMAAGVYFGGTGHLPLAMTGTVLFVALGGLGFELARRRGA